MVQPRICTRAVPFILTRQERNCSDFSQIQAHGVICIDRFLNLPFGVTNIPLWSRLRIKELACLLERDAKRFVPFW